MRALDLRHAAELKAAGADFVTAATTEAGMALGSRMLQELGGRDNDVAGLTRALRKQLDARSHEMMRIMRNELPAPAATVSEEDEVFVFDLEKVSKADMPSSNTLATPKAAAPPRGQETANAMGLQEAPADRPVVVSQGPRDDKQATASNNTSEGEAHSSQKAGPNSDDELRNKFRDGADSCPVDSFQGKVPAGSQGTSDKD